MSKPNFKNKKLKPSEILAKTLFRINVIPAFGRGSYQKNKKLLKDYGKQQIQEQEFLNAIDENIYDDVQLSKTHDERKELRKQKLNSIIEAANTFKLRRERAKELDDQIAVLKKEKAKLLSDIPVLAEKMMRYHQINKKDTYGGEFVSTGDEQAREACKDFKEFLEMNTDTEQTKLLDEQLHELRTNNKIDFEMLNNETRAKLFPELKKYLESLVDKITKEDKYVFTFKIGNKWKSKKLTPELYKQLLSNFSEKNFMIDLYVDNLNINFSDPEESDIPSWSLYSAIHIMKLEDFIKLHPSSKIEKQIYKDKGGHFFDYVTVESVKKPVIDYLNRLQIFDKLTDINNRTRKELYDCCWIYALKSSGLFDDETLDKIRLRVKNKYLSSTKIDAICEEFYIHCIIHELDDEVVGHNKCRLSAPQKALKRKTYLGVDKKEAKYILELNLYQKHYFIEERSPITEYYLDHMNTLNETEYNVFYEGSHKCRAKGKRTKEALTSRNLVKKMFAKQLFRPITYSEYLKISDITKPSVKQINDLHYNPKFCLKSFEQIAKEKEFNSIRYKSKTISDYYYADFEADTTGIHRAFYCCITNENEIKHFKGEDCAIELLKYIPDNSCVYFHNLKYDFCMIAKHVDELSNQIAKDNRLMRITVKYNKKTIVFKDSFSIIPSALKQFPKMFNLKNTQKELFPYNYYTLERLKNNTGIISEAGEYEAKKWNLEDYELFNKNINTIPGCRLSDNTFDMYKYCGFYCEQDTKILREGFLKFREGFMNDFDIDIHDYCSISSLADATLTKQVYSKNKNLYKLGGIIREFMQQAVHGGRCMTAYNKKWHSTTPIVDYDAVSLYASAMHRLYMVEGTPSVIETDEQRSYEFFQNQSAYVVEIEITKVNKHFAFPLLVFEDDEGNNFNNDVIDKPVRTAVDNIYLEDLIEFQKIEFTIIKGYFWTGNRDYSIQKVIGDIFNKRAAYKKEKNPLEVIYKLIMNSLNGKTIQKPVDYEIKYINENDIGKYWSKNYNKIIESSKIADSRNKTHVVKTQKQIDTHFTFNLFGIHILSMSKRIMNEVMCLAHDLNCQIYYQDTDSMHIRIDDLPRLEEAFKIKYNRDLKGTQLGNFHSDFPLNALYASESYFLGKKMYIDKLVLPENKTSNMFRMKGIKQSAVEAKAKDSDNSNDSLMKLYKYIYKGKTVEFDLTNGSPCFEFEKDFTVASLDTFKRRIKTSLEKGIPPKG